MNVGVWGATVMLRILVNVLLIGLFAPGCMRAELVWDELPVPAVVRGYAIKQFAINNKDTIWALGFGPSNDSALFRWDNITKQWKDHPKNLDNLVVFSLSWDNVLFAIQKLGNKALLYAWNGSTWQEIHSIENVSTITSMAALNQHKIYIIVNERVYVFDNEIWKQVGVHEGFREVAVGSDGSLYARRFNFQKALDPKTAFPASALQVVFWNGSTWDALETRTDDKAVLSITVVNKDTIYGIVRVPEDTAGGAAYKLMPGSSRLIPVGDRTDLSTIAAAQGVVWALSWLPHPEDRKFYTLVDKKQVPSENPASSAPTVLQKVRSLLEAPIPQPTAPVLPESVENYPLPMPVQPAPAPAHPPMGGQWAPPMGGQFQPNMYPHHPITGPQPATGPVAPPPPMLPPSASPPSLSPQSITVPAPLGWTINIQPQQGGTSPMGSNPITPLPPKPPLPMPSQPPSGSTPPPNPTLPVPPQPLPSGPTPPSGGVTP
jgi:hypothetical protein